MKIPPQTTDAVSDLLTVASDLRDKNGGCPWDLEQTHASLAKHLLEESSELIDVIERGINKDSDADFKEELGDVLFQVVIHAELARAEGRFNFQDVARGIADKLIARHPHVYGDVQAANSGEVLKNWEAIKARERQKKQTRVSVLDGVPKSLAALQRSERMGEKASRIGFDWPEGAAGTRQIREKITEELNELDAAMVESPARQEEELGDLLFALAQYGRRLGIDSEGALRKACNKFDQRFRIVESDAQPQIAAGKNLAPEEWDALWKKAKTTPLSMGEGAGG